MRGGVGYLEDGVTIAGSTLTWIQGPAQPGRSTLRMSIE